MSLVINNGLNRQGKVINILIENGIIQEIKNKNLKGIEHIIDAKNSLVTESFISPHIHLDKAAIGDIIEPNVSGTLWEAIQKTWDVKRNYTVDNIVDRASNIVDAQIKYGVTHIRTHIDVDSIGGLMPLNGLLAVKEKYKGICDIEIIAFPQEGILKDRKGTEELLYKAMETGATHVGGMPHNENTPEDSRKHVNILFDIAERFNVDIDSHTDETDDPNSRTLQYMAAEAIKRNFKNQVTVDHICALSSYDDYHAARVIDLVKRSGINVVSNPPTNMVLQGRLDTGAQRVGITRVKELIAAGVNVTCGQDCINDPYYPFGAGDMLQVANLMGHAAKMTMQHEIDYLYNMITKNAAKIMNLTNHELVEGAPANLVILHGVKSVHEAIRLMPPARTTIRNGKVIYKTSFTEEKFY